MTGGRSSTELFLRTLVAVETVTLIITTRGIALPLGIHWSNMTMAMLDPLSLDAAQAVFTDVAGEPDSPTETDATTELMRAVDCMPLTVWLLAQLAQQGNLPLVLLKWWVGFTTRALQIEAGGREYSIEVSVKLSLLCLPAIKGNPGPRHLLSVCSQLPDRLLPSVYEQLRDYFDNIDAAAGLL